LALLEDDGHTDQVIVQTVSRFLKEGPLKLFLEKLATHRLMTGRGDMQAVVPAYAFYPGDHREEGMSPT
jgi:hypothetical protein